MSTEQTEVIGQDDKGQDLRIGDSIRGVENAWHGQIQSAYDDSGITMLVCKGINFWSGEIDEDDVQHYAAMDVVKWTRAAQPGDLVNGINMM